MNWRKIWWFIWKDDSFASLLVNIVLAIVIIKFLIFPVLGLVLGTSFPIVAVVSCSMQHDATNCWPDCYLKGQGDLSSCWAKEKTICGVASNEEFWDVCGEWYGSEDITEERFSTFQQSKGFNIGDIFILRKAKEIEVGDVIVYSNGINDAPIIHRVIGIGNGFYRTKGDHNFGVSNFERAIKKEQIHGKVLLKIPYLGWVKVMFNILLKGIGIL
jgi:hypothetical protein